MMTSEIILGSGTTGHHSVSVAPHSLHLPLYIINHCIVIDYIVISICFGEVMESLE